MRRSILFLVCLLSFAGSAHAAVELALEGRQIVTIHEVYLREGQAYLAVDDVLPALGLGGWWDSVAHVYHFKTPRGRATISPGSHYLRIGEDFIPIATPPRFIDGRLRVIDTFVSEQLALLLNKPVYYRNLDPQQTLVSDEDSSMDRLFAFLLRKKRSDNGPALRGVAIDPGHGGLDTGVIGPGGSKEKEISLAVGKRLEKLIKMRLGIPVFISRDEDYALTRQQHLEAAARPDVDALVLLHAQSSFRPEPRGVTLVVRPVEEYENEAVPAGEGDSLRLARHIKNALLKKNLFCGEILQEPLPPLGRGSLPTVLVEMGYLSNPDDLQRLQSPAGRQQMAEALFDGLQSFANEKKEKQK